MPFVDRATVRGLFGHLDHTVSLRGAERVTILAGPNGSGKTHLLKIIAGIVGLDFQSIVALPFEQVKVEYSDGSSLEATRGAPWDASFLIVGESSDGARRSYDLDLRQAADASLPDFIERTAPDLWVDTRDGEELTENELRNRYAHDTSLAADDFIKHIPWLEQYRPAASPTVILTGRLEPPLFSPRRRGTVRGFVSTRAPGAASRIATYTERISDLISEARSASLTTSQVADRQFASRALDKARASVQESVLRNRYSEVSGLASERLDRGDYRGGLSGRTHESDGETDPESVPRRLGGETSTSSTCAPED